MLKIRNLVVDRQLATLLFGLSAVALMLLIASRNNGYYADDWSWIVNHDRTSPTLKGIFSPHNGHPYILQVPLFALTLKLGGLDHYWVPQAVFTTALVAAALCFYVYAAKRVDSWLAVSATLMLAGMGYAVEGLLSPFQIGFAICVGSAIIAWECIGSSNPKIRWFGVFALCMAVLNTGVGVAFLIALAVRFILDRDRVSFRLCMLVAIIFVTWYLLHPRIPNSGVTFHAKNLIHFPQYGFDLLSAAVGGIFGFPIEYGKLLFAVIVAIFGFRLMLNMSGRYLVFIPSKESRSALLGLSAGLGTYLVLLTLSRWSITPPDAGRYLYVTAFFISMITVEVLKGVRLSSRQHLLLPPVVVLAILGGLVPIRDYRNVRIDASEQYSARVALAAALDGVTDSSKYVPAPFTAHYITARAVLDAEKKFGSGVAVEHTNIASAKTSLTPLLDTTLADAGVVKLERTSRRGRGRPVVQVNSNSAVLAVNSPDSCSLLSSRKGLIQHFELRVSPGSSLTTTVNSGAALKWYRFSSDAKASPIPPTISPGTGASFQFNTKNDGLQKPYILVIDGLTRARVCS